MKIDFEIIKFWIFKISLIVRIDPCINSKETSIASISYFECNKINDKLKENKSKEKFFNIILKQLLFDNGIKLPSTILLKPPSFNYIIYCKFLKSKLIKEIIEMVSGEIFITGSYGKYKYLEQELYKLYIRASTCFSQLHGLSIEIDKVDTDLLYKMSQLFDVQRKLKSVSFEFHIKKGPTCKELSEALARKGNTINKLNLQSATLVEKTRGDISQVNIYTVAENTGIFIKAIANNCSNIEQLSTYLVPEDFDYVKSLLLNCDNLLDILTKFSPKSFLIVISAGCKYSVDAFERFFKSCRKRKLYFFGITYNSDNFENITYKHSSGAIRVLFTDIKLPALLNNLSEAVANFERIGNCLACKSYQVKGSQ
ncbi:hypothetical protein GLOIN_2v1781297 [Rhizophagus irregularis DAOM 181602=DAOM 197198]|uniref:Uncharacterized protein n=1 Tax=Rhizophagus irregularis (strain DAOM 181602 / DAOM 197198 / MUCL 43194) TaxID=747089 RepID=A0A2P4PKB2_RHIID|nr:hypothetical protein GLOIN_2v1781297 [Rhizophagus irregularis DAOM 181602=DAOM 197198]POG65831.1 hypothetical protein GLOIN_2v1781297 [Rhizophagus irregularis DAOM 181602=DAOM 197198]CAG8675986.1 4617_t:CDS:2 [Rhizophagus irregularis]|eukprot:XP_025172697.1 hypothetical protein GLOIN_2v1781297 [Rhizophagus irregularis DAOM 181602=DAOM 197198]